LNLQSWLNVRQGLIQIWNSIARCSKITHNKINPHIEHTDRIKVLKRIWFCSNKVNRRPIYVCTVCLQRARQAKIQASAGIIYACSTFTELPTLNFTFMDEVYRPVKKDKYIEYSCAWGIASNYIKAVFWLLYQNKARNLTVILFSFSVAQYPTAKTSFLSHIFLPFPKCAT